ncbi:hypothetical protein C922_05831 [Plasmodium inui San Antonio 1]|uniref:Uncharacterized protein n=1 Tax=Plasmodium inui San Antonio 1 TaxID=1237626 RepID=W6ZWW4_9APIC|nr:hypothetical protein C922_05831 [Plasmodium inui San Antonio 1]EUD63788.1 hypothetical protein C922_05831 [Plasmodium inui San Antonio 1]
MATYLKCKYHDYTDAVVLPNTNNIPMCKREPLSLVYYCFRSDNVHRVLLVLSYYGERFCSVGCPIMNIIIFELGFYGKVFLYEEYGDFNDIVVSIKPLFE